jgi:translocator protein
MLRILATVAFTGTLAVNALANILPINGLNTGQVSDLYPSLFTPAGLTFSIWSVIYLLLAGFVVLSWVRRSDLVILRLLPWFIVSCVLNMSWILVWHYLYVDLSVVVMLAILWVQIQLFRIVHRAYVTSWSGQLFIALPFTIYLAWICVATIANISACLVAQGWGGGFVSPEGWTIVMMTVAALLACKITIDYRTPFFAIVVLWALLGIGIRWWGNGHTIIIMSAAVQMAAIIMMLIYVTRRSVRA